MTPSEIRAARAANPKARARDFAHSLNLTEAALVAAYVGETATRIAASPAQIMPLIPPIGDVMALTRNESAVHEKRGVYGSYEGGAHVGLILGKEIDLRMFPSHWASAFAVVEPGEDGAMKRSIQIFDAAGDAVHKIHLKPESDVVAFAGLVAALKLADQGQEQAVVPRKAKEGVKADPALRGGLLADWKDMTDTHQFVRIVAKHGMNRLGAYRLAGIPYAKPLAKDAVTVALTKASAGGYPIMIFVGNAGCIQIHSGLVEKIVPMGPWINVMDARFNLHLRADHVAEVWLVEKPTKRGPAVSIEAFDAEGELILQMFGKRISEESSAGVEEWNAMARSLADAELVTVLV